MVAPENELLAEELTQTLDALLGRRLVLFATAPLKSLPWALRATVFAVALVALTVAAGALCSEPATFRAIDVWAGLLLLVTLIAYQWLAEQVKRLAHTTITPELSLDVVKQARAWGATHFLLNRQAAVCMGVGLLTAAPLIPTLRIFAGHQGPATLFLICLGSAMVTNLIYIPASVSVLSLLAANSRIALFPLDPWRTRLVGALSKLGQSTVVVSAATATVGALGPLLLPGLGLIADVLAGLVLLGAVLASLAQYFVQQYALGSLLSRTRIESMAALQAEIAPLFARRLELSQDERGALDQLLALYDRVLAVSIKTFSARGALRFASPLFIPLLTMVLSALHINVPEQSPIWILMRKLLKS